MKRFCPTTLLDYKIIKIFLTWSLIFKLSSHAAAVKSRCLNQHGDLGSCVLRDSCASAQGVNIGLCPTKDFVERICCYDLPCRGLDLRESLRLAMSRNSTVKRSKRSLVHDNELPIMAQVDPMCGLRLGSDETQHISHRGSPLQSIRSPHSRIFSRQSQLINGVTLKFDDNRFPWMLALWTIQFNLRAPTCGAALVSYRHVITAAHCVNAAGAKDFVLRGGSVLNELPDISPTNFLGFSSDASEDAGGQLMEIEKIVLHPKFNPFTFENDIAVITLKYEIRPSQDLFPICLPPPVKNGKVTDYSGVEMAITGWGCQQERCKFEESPRYLQETVMTAIPNNLAMCWFMNDSVKEGAAEYIPKKLFIVGGDESGSTTTCHGDSGSPVVHPVHSSMFGTRYEVIGLVSWSKGCGRPFRPSVWTRVETFVSWVLEQMRT